MNVQKVNYNQKDAPYEFTRSLKQTGFSILTNHPIKKDLIDNVYMEWKSFFNSSLKNKYLFDPIKQDGYFPFLTENAKGHSLNEAKRYKILVPIITPITPPITHDKTASMINCSMIAL